MTYDDLRRYYGTQVKIAAAVGVTQGTVSTWKKKGIPFDIQCRVEIITDGGLRANRALVPQPQQAAEEWDGRERRQLA
jgi:hypothetical protein